MENRTMSTERCQHSRRARIEWQETNELVSDPLSAMSGRPKTTKQLEVFAESRMARRCALTPRRPPRVSSPPWAWTPKLGRAFIPEEDQPNGPSAVILMHPF